VAERRLFFALWPDDEQRQSLGAVIPLALRSVDGVPAKSSNWHVTLVFLGNVDERRIPAVRDAVAGIRVDPFGLCLDQLSYWRQPKIACLEASDTPAELISLVRRLQDALKGLAFSPEARRYRPHVTIARKVRPFSPGPLAQPLALGWSGFELVESISGKRGVEYRPMKQQLRRDS
jgi:2'-5' RNA ligase